MGRGRVRVSGGAAFSQRPRLPEEGLAIMSASGRSLRKMGSSFAVSPTGTGPARKRKRERPEERDARDWLHAELDALGNRKPTPEEFVKLISLAMKAFAKGTVARRMIGLLLYLGKSNVAGG